MPRPSCYPILLMSVFFAGPLRPQSMDVATRLKTLQSDLDAANSSANIDTALDAICQDPPTLAQCQQWGLELAAKTNDEDAPAHREAVAGVLRALRRIHGQTHAPVQQ